MDTMLYAYLKNKLIMFYRTPLNLICIFVQKMKTKKYGIILIKNKLNVDLIIKMKFYTFILL